MLQAPFSTAKGPIPSLEHLASYLECFRTSAAEPAETPASKIIEELSGEVTCSYIMRRATVVSADLVVLIIHKYHTQ